MINWYDNLGLSHMLAFRHFMIFHEWSDLPVCMHDADLLSIYQSLNLFHIDAYENSCYFSNYT